MTTAVWGLVLGLLLPAMSHAQGKPIGAFSAEGAPPWVSFGMIGQHAPDEDVAAAVAKCARGFRLVLSVGYDAHPLADAAIATAQARARFERLGAWPCVAGMSYGEEWYEHFYANAFAPYGVPASRPDGPEQVHAWMSRQHASAKRASGGLPIVWITGMVYGRRAVPAHTDYVMLDPYQADDEAFETAIEPIFVHAERETALPLIATCRWFANTGPYQGEQWDRARRPPTPSAIEGCARVLARPRYVALFGFLWQSRPYADLVGLADMPEVRAIVERSLGVR